MPPAIRNFLISFTISAVLFSFLAYYAVRIIRVTVFDREDPTVTSEEVSSDSASEGASSGTSSGDSPVIGGNILNFLLIGTDYQPDLFDDYTVPFDSLQPERKKIADTILYVSYIPQNGLLLVCPIPSLTMTEFDGITTTLGEAYHYKGAAFLTEKVSTLVGQPIPYYGAVSIGGMAEIIDTLGGMRYNVPRDMQYESLDHTVKIDLKKGEQELTGEQVMQMLRYNGYGDTDTRTALQGEFFYQFLCRHANYTNKRNYTTVFGTLLPYLETNVTLNDLTDYLSVLFGYQSLAYTRVNYPGAYSDRYFMPNTDSAQAIFAGYLQEQQDK